MIATWGLWWRVVGIANLVGRGMGKEEVGSGMKRAGVGGVGAN
jgi:hypothetical protein